MKTLITLLLACCFGSAMAQTTVEKGKTISIEIPADTDTACNVEVVRGGEKTDVRVESNKKGVYQFAGRESGEETIRWEGKMKFRGLKTLGPCRGDGSIRVVTTESVEAIEAAKQAQKAEQDAKQAKVTMDAQAEREMAEQQLLEQERRVAEQKAQAARLLAKEAELAQVREQLAKAKQQAAAVSNGPVTSAPQTQLSSVTSPNANRRKALVFGNDKYLSVSPLQNAVADGEAMAAKLQALGYAVTSSYNVSRKEMLSAVRNFSGRVQGGDEVIFFYAGHGVELEGRNYLLPIDIHGDDSRQVRDDAIELQRILTDMSDSRAKFTLAVVDACRDNPFVSAGRAIGGRGLAPTTAATGQMVIFSAGAGQQALDRLDANDKSPNGLFTRIFMEEMSEPNVPIDRVVKKVRQKVFQAAQTVGHDQVPAIYDQVVGDFFFVKK
jgi:hypothetical protein